MSNRSSQAYLDLHLLGDNSPDASRTHLCPFCSHRCKGWVAGATATRRAAVGQRSIHTSVHYGHTFVTRTVAFLTPPASCPDVLGTL